MDIDTTITAGSVAAGLGGAGDPNALDTGEYALNRLLGVQPIYALASGLPIITYFTAAKTENITSISYATADVAAGARTLVKVGVYAISSGTWQRVAVSGNNTAHLTATDTVYTAALTSAWAKTKGTRYAVVLLTTGTGAAPKLVGHQAPRPEMGATVGFQRSPSLSGNLNGQLGTASDLPTAFSASGVDTEFRIVQFLMNPA